MISVLMILDVSNNSDKITWILTKNKAPSTVSPVAECFNFGLLQLRDRFDSIPKQSFINTLKLNLKCSDV